MNHDYAHCLDYTANCPDECFRAQLQRDLEERRSEFIGVPLTCSHLGGTVECKLANSHKKVWKGEWIPVTERLPDISGSYLATVYSGKHSPFVNVDYFFKSTGEWDYYRVDVVAWAEMPEPWKGEEG